MATVSSVLLFLLKVKYVAQQYTQNALLHFHGNSQQCFIVFVERKIRSSTIHTERIVAFPWLQWLHGLSTMLRHTYTAYFPMANLK
jgi:hypothetical protein